MFKPSAELELLEELSSSPPQAAATSEKANTIARSLNRRLFRILNIPLFEIIYRGLRTGLSNLVLNNAKDFL
jgi:hypothetical protein